MKALTRLAMLVVLTALLAACGASRPIDADESDGPKKGSKGSGKNVVRGDAVEMWVESDGDRLPLFHAEGRQYLLGRMGDPYEVVVANRSRNRVEVVLSVDGRDAVSGREADFRANRGYVLDPGEKTRVQGFRTSLDGVAAFEFSTPEESYSERMGTPENVGVIGLAVFDESEDSRQSDDAVIAGGGEDENRPDYPRPEEYGAADSAPSAQMESAKTAGGAAPSSPGLGTKYGHEIDSSATVVPFVRRDPEKPLELLALYYNDREGLEALGIKLPPEEREPGDRCGDGPNPFPGVPCEDDGYAPPPPPLHQEE